MNDDHSHRELLLKGALCGGLILVGFLSGGTLPALAVAGGIAAGSLGGIGGNLAASLIENALHQWRAQWLSPAGARSADIAAALCQAFERAVQQIAQEWRNDATRAEALYRDLTSRIGGAIDWGEKGRFVLQYLRPIGKYLARRFKRPLWPTVIKAWQRNRRHRQRYTRRSLTSRPHRGKDTRK
jgi:hypothetical protein